MQIPQILQNDQVRIVAALLFQALLCYPLRLIPISLRPTYSLLLGTLLQLLVFFEQALVIMGFSVAMYALTKAAGSRCGFYATTVGMLFLSGYHVHGVIYKYGENNMGGAVLLMIMVCKYSLFAYAYQDGHYKLKDREEKQADGQKDKKQFNIDTDVSLMDYIGYVQFLPTAVMGPPIEYKIYEAYMKNQGIFAQALPSRKPIMVQTLKQLAICLPLFYASLTILTPQYIKSPQFLHPNTSGLYIFAYTVLAMTLIRFKYYSAWKIGILSVHISHLSYNPATQDYTKIDHCKVAIIEGSPHIREKIGNWNIMVQEWLRKCVYERVGFKSRFAKQLYVFMVSAFWHGFYAGYYFSFFLWFAQVYVQAEIFRLFKNDNNPMVKICQKLGKPLIIGMTILSCILFSHNATFFYLLQTKYCLELMRRVYYIPQLILVVAIIGFKAIPKKRAPKVHHGNKFLETKSSSGSSVGSGLGL